MPPRLDQDGLFFPVQTRRSFEEAVHQIASAIQAGDLPVGERLPSEREVAMAMGISRPTVRAAVRLLRTAGLLTVTPSGIFVASDSVPADLIEHRIDIVRTEISSVLETRRLFEPRVAQLAGVFASEKDFARMQQVLVRQRQVIADHDRFTRAADRFHIVMAQATGNSTVVAIMRGLLGRLAIAFDLEHRIPLDEERAIRVHERTLDALMRRDPILIDEAMDEHLGLLERFWEEASGIGRLRRLPAHVTRERDAWKTESG